MYVKLKHTKGVVNLHSSDIELPKTYIVVVNLKGTNACIHKAGITFLNLKGIDIGLSKIYIYYTLIFVLLKWVWGGQTKRH